MGRSSSSAASKKTSDTPSSLAALTARHLMTAHPVTVSPDETIQVALERFTESNIRHLPVIEDGKIIGILSDRDVTGATAASLPELLEDPDRARRQLLTSVRSVYSSDIISVTPEASLEDILSVILEEKVGAVPVVEERDAKLVGIVSYVDILKALQESL